MRKDEEPKTPRYTSAAVTRNYIIIYNIIPNIYFLKRLNPAKYNYKIYNKELLAIIKYFK